MLWYSKGTKRTLRYFPTTTAAVAAFDATEGRFAGGVQAGPKSSTFYNNIASFEIANGGTYAENWGTLSQARTRNMCLASQLSGSRLTSAGGTISGGTAQDTIDYHEFSTGGTSTDFGNLTEALLYLGGYATSTIGYRLGGYDNSTNKKDTIAKITFASPGNETSFDTLSGLRYSLKGFHTSLYGFNTGGADTTTTRLTSCIKFEFSSETVITEDYADLTAGRYEQSAGGSETRIICAGGVNTAGSYVNTMDYFEVASGGSCTSFGTLLSVLGPANSCPSSQTTMIISYGALGTFSYYKTVEQVTIASPGNATSFATHSQSRGNTGAYSGTP